MLLKNKKYILLCLFCIPCAYADKLSIKINGLESYPKALKNVQNTLSIYAFEGREAPPALRLEWLNDQAADEIQSALEPYGFYRATSTSNITKSNDTWVVTYNIKPDEPVKIDELVFKIDGEGRRKRIFKYIIKESKLRLDNPINDPDYEKTKNQLSEAALARGYFDSYFPEHEIIINLDDYTSQVFLSFDTGPRYYFGDIKFQPNYFSDKFLRRYLLVDRQSEFSDQKLAELQSDLDASDYFEEVTITPTIDKENKTVPLDIVVKPKKRRVFSAGIGYSTDIGARLSGNATWRYINRRGHKFNVELLLAQKQRKGIINYRIPGKYPASTFFDLYLKYDFENTKYKDYTTFIVGGSSNFKKGNFEKVFALDYRQDRFTPPNREKTKTNLLVPSFKYTWQSSQNVWFTQPAFKGSIMVRGSAKQLISDINFIQVRFEGTYFQPISKNDRLILRGQLGYTFVSHKDLYRLSPALLFQTGGDNSVRGYRYNGIGPMGNKKNEIYGGKRLTVASVEWERKITKDWSGVTFVDAGDAYNGGRPKWKVGAGVGIRWYSPIGAIKFDVAHGFNRKYGDTIRFHLNIGATL